VSRASGPDGAFQIDVVLGTHGDPILESLCRACGEGSGCKSCRPALPLRHVFPSWVQHIRKEANRLEDVERGDVSDWDEVLERFERRGKGEWEVEVLPALIGLGAERVAAVSGVSARQVYRILKSGRRPPPRTERVLIKVVLPHLTAIG
jgi:hypothetical protein